MVHRPTQDAPILTVMTSDPGFAPFWRSLNAPCYVVYRMYDGEGTLRYVGYTGSFRRRMWEHYRNKPWVREEVEHVEVEAGLTYDEARALDVCCQVDSHNSLMRLEVVPTPG